jgi:hypothetical protein
MPSTHPGPEDQCSPPNSVSHSRAIEPQAVHTHPTSTTVHIHHCQHPPSVLRELDRRPCILGLICGPASLNLASPKLAYEPKAACKACLPCVNFAKISGVFGDLPRPLRILPNFVLSALASSTLMNRKISSNEAMRLTRNEHHRKLRAPIGDISDWLMNADVSEFATPAGEWLHQCTWPGR